MLLAFGVSLVSRAYPKLFFLNRVPSAIHAHATAVHRLSLKIRNGRDPGGIICCGCRLLSSVQSLLPKIGRGIIGHHLRMSDKLEGVRSTLIIAIKQPRWFQDYSM